MHEQYSYEIQPYFRDVGLGVGHTIDPTSYLEKLTNSIASDHYSIGLS